MRRASKHRSTPATAGIPHGHKHSEPGNKTHHHQVNPPSAQQVADRLREIHTDHPGNQCKCLSIEQLNAILDQGTDQNWQGQYAEKPHRENTLTVIGALIFPLIPAGALAPVIITYIILSPQRYKTTAELTIPTYAGTDLAQNTIVTSWKHGRHIALNRAIQDFIRQHSSATSDRTALPPTVSYSENPATSRGARHAQGNQKPH